MNILILPSWYTMPENPISGIFFKEQAQALQSYFDRFDKGSRVFVLAVEAFSVRALRTFFKRKGFVFADEDGIPTARTRFMNIPKAGRLNYMLCGKRLAHCVRKFQKQLGIGFDLVHVHSALDAGIWYAHSGLRLPYVITEHASAYSRGLVTAGQKRCLPQVFDNASRIIAVGNGLVAELHKYTKKPVEVIFNIVAPFFSVPQGNVRKSEAFTFFSLGVNARTKGFDILLSAFSDYIMRGNSGRLIIAGLTEAEKQWLLSFTPSHKVMQHLELRGKLGRDEVMQEMACCDCFVLVSRHETFGVVFAEAMYCGKPVIASRTGGPDSFVNEENGILVHTEHVDETAAALAAMRSEYSRYDAGKIRAYAEAQFSPDVICGKLKSVYDSIVVDGGGYSNTLIFGSCPHVLRFCSGGHAWAA